MRLASAAALLLVVFTAAAFAQGTKRVTGVDLSAIDRNVSPCMYFYQYACGNWIAAHPIPPDESLWDRFNELTERNREILRQILERASADGSTRTPIEQKIGDYYSACMDEKAADARGYDPVKPELARVEANRQ